MPLVKQKLKPGFDSLSTQTENSGGWFEGNLLRWRLGHLEKLGGWRRLIETPCMQHIRALHGWQDLNANENLLIGTDAGPQLIVNTTLFNFSAAAASATTGDTTFSANIGSPVVTVTSPYVAVVGGRFVTTMTMSIGGIIIPANSSFTITGLVGGGFTFNMGTNAAATETNTVGVPTFINDPTNAAYGIVTLNAHGLVAGNTFPIQKYTVFTTVGSGITNVTFGYINANAVLTVLAAPAPTANTFEFDWTIINGAPPTTGTAIPVAATEGDTVPGGSG